MSSLKTGNWAATDALKTEERSLDIADEASRVQYGPPRVMADTRAM
jgi:hypothetical protein